MAAHSSILALEDFHCRYDGEKPAYEFWQGTASQKSLPTYLHSLIQTLLMSMLQRAGWISVAELRVRVAPDKELVPDVIATRTPPEEPYPTIAVELCVEVLSPNDLVSKLLVKAGEYIAWGSQAVWLIDPVQRMAWSITHEGVFWVAPGGTLRVDGTEIKLNDLFAEADRLRRPQPPG